MTKIISSIISWGKNLSFKELIIVILLLVTVGSVWAANGYRNESIQLQTVLDARKTVEEIERDNAKLESNTKEIERLRNKMEKKNDKIEYLSDKLEQIRNNPNTRTQVMEELGELNTTQDICNAFTKSGYNICD